MGVRREITHLTTSASHPSLSDGVRASVKEAHHKSVTAWTAVMSN